MQPVTWGQPRLVKHLEDKTLAALTDFYSVVFPKDRDAWLMGQRRTVATSNRL